MASRYLLETVPGTVLEMFRIQEVASISRRGEGSPAASAPHFCLVLLLCSMHTTRMRLLNPDSFLWGAVRAFKTLTWLHQRFFSLKLLKMFPGPKKHSDLKETIDCIFPCQIRPLFNMVRATTEVAEVENGVICGWRTETLQGN